MVKKPTYLELEGRVRSYKLRCERLESQFKKLNRKPNGELKQDYKLMIAFGVILDVCQRYKVVEEDRSNKGLNLKRGVIDGDGDDFDFLRPKDVTGQWILDQINVQYELISRIIGDNPSGKVYYVKRLGCSRDLGCQDVNFL